MKTKAILLAVLTNGFLFGEPLTFTILKDVPRLAVYEIAWDLGRNTFDVNYAAGTVFLGGGFDGMSSADVAAQLAAAINKAAPNSVSVQGSVVTLIATDTYRGVSIKPFETTPDFVTLSATLQPNAPLGFKFDPDPDTGQAVLVDAGKVIVTGPSGVLLSYLPPAGTTGDELAATIAAALEPGGFNVTLAGAQVIFSSPVASSIAFLADTPGTDNFLQVIPEPGTFVVGSAALIGLMCLRRCKGVAIA